MADTDSDADGVEDCFDACPLDSDRVAPGICGCGAPDDPTDLDEDGTPDCVDNCAPPTANDQADTDADGVGDDCDVCPDDGGLVDPSGCPLPPVWQSSVGLFPTLTDYADPEFYEFEGNVLVLATLGLSKEAVAVYGAIQMFQPEVEPGVATVVFETDDGDSITTETVTITTFTLELNGRDVTWTFEYTRVRILEDLFGTERTQARFKGTQTGRLSPEGDIIAWDEVTGTRNGYDLVPDDNWALGVWTFLQP